MRYYLFLTCCFFTVHISAQKGLAKPAGLYLRYPDSGRLVSFYNEFTVPATADPVNVQYRPLGFSRGYMSVVINGKGQRRIVFSVQGSGEAVNMRKLTGADKVALLAQGEDVITTDSGKRSTGGDSYYVYQWKTGEPYKFLVTALPDSASKTTIYTGYMFLPELQKWKLIAAFRAAEDGGYLKGLYSFTESSPAAIRDGKLRKVLLDNPLVQKQNGQWADLTMATYTYDLVSEKGNSAGVDAGKFFLATGDGTGNAATAGTSFERKATGLNPVVNYTGHADSVEQAARDLQLMKDAVAAKKEDTTGSKDGVFYKILKEGTGNYVSANDTIVVHYIGSLLKDGSVFDQTRDKPATFPLKRLIRGYQVALPLCRVGGRIRFLVPSALAYAMRTRDKGIPPNSVLVFDVEVVKTGS